MLGEIKGRRRRGDRGWDGWMASPTQWTQALANSGSWWRTEKPAVHAVTKSWIPLIDWKQQQANPWSMALIIFTPKPWSSWLDLQVLQLRTLAWGCNECFPDSVWQWLFPLLLLETFSFVFFSIGYRRLINKDIHKKMSIYWNEEKASWIYNSTLGLTQGQVKVCNPRYSL